MLDIFRACHEVVQGSELPKSPCLNHVLNNSHVNASHSRRQLREGAVGCQRQLRGFKMWVQSLQQISEANDTLLKIGNSRLGGSCKEQRPGGSIGIREAPELATAEVLGRRCR